MIPFKEYEQRAEKWALQSSTIIGAATIMAAAVGTGIDASTGMPWIAATIGLVAGGLTAIFLPQQNSAVAVSSIATAASELTATIQSHASNIDKASAAAVTATVALQKVAPGIEAQVQQVAGKIDALGPVILATGAMSGNKVIQTAAQDAATVLDAVAKVAVPVSSIPPDIPKGTAS